MPEISIIVPVYKVENYLRRCIDSILAQTFTDFELILVDDGSPDNCPTICDEYANKDFRIVVIHKANGGVSSARNRGLELATGKYILFCDSDDYVSKDWCETIYSVISRYPNSLIVFNAWRESPQGEDRQYIDASVQGTEDVTIITYYQSFQKDLSGAVWNKVFTRSVIREHGLQFDEHRILGEDVMFHIEYLNYIESIAYIAKPLYHYTINPNGAVRRYYPDLIGHHQEFFSARKAFIDDNDMPMFCDTYLYYFLHMLDNTLDTRNTIPFYEKMRYNHKMMNTKEFRYCVENATGKNDSKLFMKIIRLHNYYIFWVFQKFCAIKAQFERRN